MIQILPEAIKKLSYAKREGLIINFYEVESGGIYKIVTVDNPLVEQAVSDRYLDRWLAELRIRLCCHLN